MTFSEAKLHVLWERGRSMLDAGRLRLLWELAHRGTMAAVAEARLISTSAVSQQLAQLELECGAALLRREGRRVRLTPVGERLVRHAERLMAVMEEAEADLATGRREIAGRVRVAAFPSAAAALMPRAVLALRQRHPLLVLELRDDGARVGLPELRGWQLDMVLVDRIGRLQEPLDPQIELLPLFSDALHAMLPRDHPLERRPFIALADLADESWSLNDGSSVFHRALLDACREAGFTPRIVSACRSIEVTMAMVGAGCSISIQPGLWARRYQGAIGVRPLRPLIERHVSVAIRHGSLAQPAIAAAVSALQDAAAALGGGASAEPGPAWLPDAATTGPCA
ncbi:LysR family transcriptional regulator [Roseomonas hellenica]|uniref:LysR family transcriptional regulator n=1 Tax=Plastoroseomonas hellenica TaxID=2687306 RepID=A0ABS5ES58_9PROT|nr:LysR family transcriptional regulator [Plastoroseomonas hellenica]MBR0663131.1 LysR family transcriptional regulator [Plastoroseomonas hellenica]